MKRIVFFLSILALVGFASGLLAAPAQEAEPATSEVEAAQAGPAIAPVEAEQPAACVATAMTFPGPNYCGDPCDEEGQMVGCIDTSGPVWVRTMCTCQNGYLVC